MSETKAPRNRHEPDPGSVRVGASCPGARSSSMCTDSQSAHLSSQSPWQYPSRPQASEVADEIQSSPPSRSTEGNARQQGKGWQFRSQETTLWKHSQTHVQRHIKVKGAASPYDGDLLYWSHRLKNHPMCSGMKEVLLRKQQGKCRWCELLFQDTNVIEIDHITSKREGGGEELSNKFLLHRHCHDERHARRVNGISAKDPIIEEPDAGQVLMPFAPSNIAAKDPIIEEPDAGKLACPVLSPSGGGDPFA